jgi:hypothetical protein
MLDRLNAGIFGDYLRVRRRGDAEACCDNDQKSPHDFLLDACQFLLVA